MLDIATDLEIVTKRGAFFSFGDTRLGQGRENAKEFLKQNPDLLAQIEAQIRAQAVQGEAVVLNGHEDAMPGRKTESRRGSSTESEVESVAEAV